MECSGKPVCDRRASDWEKCTEEELLRLTVEAPEEAVRKRVLDCWDHVAKPLDGLGRFETLTAQIGAIQGTEHIDICQKAVLIMCADHGIVEEGVSQSPAEVTRMVAAQMGKQSSSVGKMASKAGADTIPVDIGMKGGPIPGVLDRKVRPGTGNFRRGCAMTREEAVRAVCVGIAMAKECRDAGYRILATGEMGIGNTTASSAVAAALLGCSAEEVTGRGAGLDDARLLHKKRVIEEALEYHGLLQDAHALSQEEISRPELSRAGLSLPEERSGREYTLRVLSCVGGLDIAGLAGVCIGGALYRLPVVLDGVISMTAALLAQRLVPGVSDFLLPSHMGREPAAEKLADALALNPVIHAQMALGEGTGAVMMLSLLDIALCVYQKQLTFSDMGLERYERFDQS